MATFDVLVFAFVTVFLGTVVLTYFMYWMFGHGDTCVPLISTMAAHRPQCYFFATGMAWSGLVLMVLECVWSARAWFLYPDSTPIRFLAVCAGVSGVIASGGLSMIGVVNYGVDDEAMIHVAIANVFTSCFLASNLATAILTAVVESTSSSPDIRLLVWRFGTFVAACGIGVLFGVLYFTAHGELPSLTGHKKKIPLGSFVKVQGREKKTFALEVINDLFKPPTADNGRLIRNQNQLLQRRQLKAGKSSMGQSAYAVVTATAAPAAASDPDPQPTVQQPAESPPAAQIFCARPPGRPDSPESSSADSSRWAIVRHPSNLEVEDGLALEREEHGEGADDAKEGPNANQEECAEALGPTPVELKFAAVLEYAGLLLIIVYIYSLAEDLASMQLVLSV